jgi:hypothetical protein
VLYVVMPNRVFEPKVVLQRPKVGLLWEMVSPVGGLAVTSSSRISDLSALVARAVAVYG